MKDSLFQYLLCLGDNTMILGHRLSELCGHGPSLESDIALTNISLDLFGQTRNYFQYAATLNDRLTSEDEIAFLRYPNEYRNVWLVEQPNHDFAQIILRQFFFDQYHHLLLEQLTQSQDEQIAAIAAKSIKEVAYHRNFSTNWVKRLGEGTDLSNHKMQHALEHLYPFVDELTYISAIDEEMHSYGIGADLSMLKNRFDKDYMEILTSSGLSIPEISKIDCQGKQGIHTEHHGYILTELQYMQRTYPNMEW